MNRQFYEFWNSCFIDVTQGQKQLAEMSTWIKQGLDGFNDLATLFQSCCGQKNPWSGGFQDAQTWWQSIADSQKDFTRFAAQWGWVRSSEHQQALDKCAELEEKIQEQQATITQLRGLLSQEGLGHTELYEHFKRSIKDQNIQFQTLMKSIRSAGESGS